MRQPAEVFFSSGRRIPQFEKSNVLVMYVWEIPCICGFWFCWFCFVLSGPTGSGAYEVFPKKYQLSVSRIWYREDVISEDAGQGLGCSIFCKRCNIVHTSRMWASSTPSTCQLIEDDFSSSRCWWRCWYGYSKAGMQTYLISLVLMSKSPV